MTACCLIDSLIGASCLLRLMKDVSATATTITQRRVNQIPKVNGAEAYSLGLRPQWAIVHFVPSGRRPH